MKTKIVVRVGLTIALLGVGVVFKGTVVSNQEYEITEMEPVRYFSSNYQTARHRFIEAAEDAGASLESFQNPREGPQGEGLFTDVAILGPTDAESVVVVSSGTHGVEGFAGSALQVGLLRGGITSSTDVGIMMIHAINPYGFAHLRRVNEDNVDLNRNFVDHSQPYPRNLGYEELSAALAPTSFSSWSDAAFLSRLQWHRLRGRTDWLREAVTGGQYSHPQGLFYGGNFETWSNKTIREIAERFLSRAERIVVVDVHTGLGEYGNAEIILNAPETDDSYSRAVVMWGPARVRSTASGDSVSTHLDGTLKLAVPAMLPDATVTAVSLEFGTSPPLKVLRALRAENWLHHRGGVDHHKATEIKSGLVRTFYPETDDWKRLVWTQGKQVVEQALGFGNP